MPIDVGNHRYRVPVLLHNVPKVQALNQVLDSLEHLDRVIDDAFSRVNSRIKSESGKVSDIRARIERCQNKVRIVQEKGKRKATTVFSASKYPAPRSRACYYRMYREEQSALSSAPDNTHRLSEEDAQATAERVNTSELFLELGGMMNAASSRQRAGSNAGGKEDGGKNGTKKQVVAGLGKLPKYLPSLNSVLLFNSSENPYKEYASYDNLVSSLTKEKDDVQEEELAAQPLSLLNGSELPQFENPMEALKYIPQIEELPTLNLPQNLPLDQLADISYLGAGQQQGSIAPSISNLSDLPTDLMDLPPIAGPSRAQPKGGTADLLSSLPDLDGPPPAPVAGGGVPPAPAAGGGGVPAPPSMSSGGGVPPPPPMAGGGVPPPPPMAGGGVPPPPPSMGGGPPPPPTGGPGIPAPPPSMGAAPAPPAPAAPAASSGGGGGGRGALLSAIRAGKKLGKKKVKRRGKKAAPAPKPMNLMDSLMARLKRHRAAIGGKEMDKPKVKVKAKAKGGGPPSKRGPPKKSEAKHDGAAEKLDLPTLDTGGGDDDDEPAPAATTGDARMQFSDDDDDDDGWESA